MTQNTKYGHKVRDQDRLMIQDEEGPVLETQFPRQMLSQEDYRMRMGFVKLNEDKIEAMKTWKEGDLLGRNRLKFIK